MTMHRTAELNVMARKMAEQIRRLADAIISRCAQGSAAERFAGKDDVSAQYSYFDFAEIHEAAARVCTAVNDAGDAARTGQGA